MDKNLIFVLLVFLTKISLFSFNRDLCLSRVSVNVEDVTYIGCQNSVSTISLNNSTQTSVSVYSFKGLPYAEAPVGTLRFQRTVEKTYFGPTTIDATRYRAGCKQPPTDNPPLYFKRASEDCLFLNIWTPTLDKDANLPVMLWIHGGAFSKGGGSSFFLLDRSLKNVYDGQLLAIRDVVVVTLNYRLGVLGFLYANRSDCPGNQGLWDQAMALNWTIQNIRSFGGNPNNITLFGQSAGSMSISYHIVSNVTRNWFQRAIMQSGSGYVNMFNRNKEESYHIARRYAFDSTIFITGECPDNDLWIECLRNKSAKELIIAQFAQFIPNITDFSTYANNIVFVPMYDDYYGFMPKSINQAVKEGDFRNDINILLGHTEMEGAYFTALFDIIRLLKKRYIPPIPVIPYPVITVEKVYKDIANVFFFGSTFNSYAANNYTQTFSDDELILNNRERNRLRASAVHSLGDQSLTCPTVLFGYQCAKHQIRNKFVYQYKLTYTNSLSLCYKSVWANPTHTDDLVLVFGMPFLNRVKFNDNDRKISVAMMNIWTYFAKYDQTPEVNGHYWPPYRGENLKYLELNPIDNRFGKVFTHAYDGIDDGYTPDVIHNCLNFWDEIISEPFLI